MEREQLFRWDEIEPLCILRLLARKLWLIVLAALTGMMAVSIVLNSLVSVHYTSGVTFAVNARSSGVSSYSSINSTAETAAIYSELLQGRMTKELIQENLGKVSCSITASQLGGTNLLQVTVTSDSPRHALAVMQTIIDHQVDLSQYVSQTAVLTVMNSPSLTSSRVQNDKARTYTLLGGAGCAAAMAALICILGASNGTVKNRIGAKNTLDAKLLASIPHEAPPFNWKKPFQKKRRDELNILSPTVSFGFTESIHQIASRLELERSRGKKVFLISSVSEAEGKSTVAANTALSLASKGGKVLFIDLDLRRPVQQKILGYEVPEYREFGALLEAGAAPEDILRAAVCRENSSLYTLLSTRSYPGLVEQLSSQLLADVITLARKRFQYVILDTPPLGYFSDSEVLSDLADASLLVVRQDLVPAPRINDAIDALRAGRSQFLGCVLNDMRHLSAGSSAYGYGYGSRYYGYGKYGKYGNYGKYGKYSYGAKETTNTEQ